jgi:hypothetical protein
MNTSNTQTTPETTLAEAELFSRFMKLPLYPNKWTAEEHLRHGGIDDVGLGVALEEWIEKAHTSDCPVADLEMVRDHLTGVLTHVELVLSGYKQFAKVVEVTAGLTDQKLTLVANLHDAIESFVDFEGSEETSRNLQTAAGMIAHVEQEMPHLADKHVKSVLGAADFQQWLDEGRTYASFARLFLGREEKVSA